MRRESARANAGYPRFHLALPVTDLLETRAFYEKVLQCRPGRESSRWVDLDFFGHQLVLHLVDPNEHPATGSNPVDGHDVPAGHFGPILDMETWTALADRLREHRVEFIIEPGIRFEGRPGEQATMFLRDPSGNALEFKAFRDIGMLFATDLQE